MIDIGTRKQGPFDPRFPRPRARADATRVEPSVDRDSVDTWEGEGGHVEAHPPRESPALPEGLSWESFCALAYPGMKRHYFRAIAPWYRYRDVDRSGVVQPVGANREEGEGSGAEAHLVGAVGRAGLLVGA